MRRQHGLPALTWNAKLAEIGRGHSVDMARHGFFSHFDTRGLDPTARATKSGFACEKQVGSSTYTGIGENLYMTGLYSRWHTTVTGSGTGARVYDWKTLDELALETVQAWMNSPGHRDNLLDPKYDSEGIGIGISADYNIYVTQDFC